MVPIERFKMNPEQELSSFDFLSWKREVESAQEELHALLNENEQGLRFKNPRIENDEPTDMDKKFDNPDELMATLFMCTKTNLMTEEEAMSIMTTFAEKTRKPFIVNFGDWPFRTTTPSILIKKFEQDMKKHGGEEEAFGWDTKTNHAAAFWNKERETLKWKETEEEKEEETEAVKKAESTYMLLKCAEDETSKAEASEELLKAMRKKIDDICERNSEGKEFLKAVRNKKAIINKLHKDAEMLTETSWKEDDQQAQRILARGITLIRSYAVHEGAQKFFSSKSRKHAVKEKKQIELMMGGKSIECDKNMRKVHEIMKMLDKWAGTSMIKRITKTTYEATTTKAQGKLRFHVAEMVKAKIRQEEEEEGERILEESRRRMTSTPDTEKGSNEGSSKEGSKDSLNEFIEIASPDITDIIINSDEEEEEEDPAREDGTKKRKRSESANEEEEKMRKEFADKVACYIREEVVKACETIRVTTKDAFDEGEACRLTEWTSQWRTGEKLVKQYVEQAASQFRADLAKNKEEEKVAERLGTLMTRTEKMLTEAGERRKRELEWRARDALKANAETKQADSSRGTIIDELKEMRQEFKEMEKRREELDVKRGMTHACMEKLRLTVREESVKSRESFNKSFGGLGNILRAMHDFLEVKTDKEIMSGEKLGMKGEGHGDCKARFVLMAAALRGVAKVLRKEESTAKMAGEVEDFSAHIELFMMGRHLSMEERTHPKVPRLGKRVSASGLTIFLKEVTEDITEEEKRESRFLLKRPRKDRRTIIPEEQDIEGDTAAAGGTSVTCLMAVSESESDVMLDLDDIVESFEELMELAKMHIPMETTWIKQIGMVKTAAEIIRGNAGDQRDLKKKVGILDATRVEMARAVQDNRRSEGECEKFRKENNLSTSGERGWPLPFNTAAMPMEDFFHHMNSGRFDLKKETREDFENQYRKLCIIGNALDSEDGSAQREEEASEEGSRSPSPVRHRKNPGEQGSRSAGSRGSSTVPERERGMRESDGRSHRRSGGVRLGNGMGGGGVSDRGQSRPEMGAGSSMLGGGRKGSQREDQRHRETGRRRERSRGPPSESEEDYSDSDDAYEHRDLSRGIRYDYGPDMVLGNQRLDRRRQNRESSRHREMHRRGMETSRVNFDVAEAQGWRKGGEGSRSGRRHREEGSEPRRSNEEREMSRLMAVADNFERRRERSRDNTSRRSTFYPQEDEWGSQTRTGSRGGSQRTNIPRSLTPMSTASSSSLGGNYILGLLDPTGVSQGVPHNVIRFAMPTRASAARLHQGGRGHSMMSGPSLLDYAPMEGVEPDANLHAAHLNGGNGIKLGKFKTPTWGGEDPEASVFEWWATIRAVAESPGISPQNRNQMIIEAVSGGKMAHLVAGCAADGQDLYGTIMRHVHTRFLSKGRQVRYYVELMNVFTAKGAGWTLDALAHLERCLRALCRVESLSQSEAGTVAEAAVKMVRRLDTSKHYSEKLYDRQNEVEDMKASRGFLDPCGSFSVWDVRKFLDDINGAAQTRHMDDIDFKSIARKQLEREQKGPGKAQVNVATTEAAATSTAAEKEVSCFVAGATQQNNFFDKNKGKKKNFTAVSQWLDRPTPTACECCGSRSHISILECTAAKNLTKRAKAGIVQKSSMCRRCLVHPRTKDHTLTTCTAPVCSNCGFTHHKDICYAIKTNAANVNIAEVDWREDEDPALDEEEVKPEEIKTQCKVVPEEEAYVAMTKTDQAQKFFTLSGIVQAKKEEENRLVRARIMLDSGSDVNFVSEEMADKLGMTGEDRILNVTGINGVTKALACRKGTIYLKDKDGRLRQYEAYTKPRILAKTASMEHLLLLSKTFGRIHEMNFDAGWGEGKIDILLGQPALLDCLGNMERLGDTGYGLQHTCFGPLPLGPADEGKLTYSMLADVYEDATEEEELKKR